MFSDINKNFLLSINEILFFKFDLIGKEQYIANEPGSLSLKQVSIQKLIFN